MEITSERRNKWPFLSAAAIFCLNVDYILIPLVFKPLGFTGWNLFFVTAIAATLEMIYWYWFWGWFANYIVRLDSVKEGIELGKELEKELKQSGLKNKIIAYATKIYRSALDPHSWKFRLIQWSEFPAMIILGIEPIIPGGRAAAVIYCRARERRACLIALLLANTVHVAYMIRGWNWMFHLFGR